MAEIVAAVAAGVGVLVSTGTVVARPAINRYREGRALARQGLAVYVPGSGRLLDFTPGERATQIALKAVLTEEKWLAAYLTPPVIDLGELVAALQAVRLLENPLPGGGRLEPAVQVLGTRKPVQKLEGILLAVHHGFLFQPPTTQDGAARVDAGGHAPNPPPAHTTRVPWRLLTDAAEPDARWRADPVLIDIWFALHCPYVFPVARGRVLAAAATYARIIAATPGALPLVKTRGGVPAKRHFEVPLADLLSEIDATEPRLLRAAAAPVVLPPTDAERLAGMLGGRQTAELLGPDVAASLTRAVVDLSANQRLGLQVHADADGRYALRCEVGQPRAERDFRAVSGRDYRLIVRGPEDRELFFTHCRTVQGTVLLERFLDEMAPGEVYADPAHVLCMAKRVDQSLSLCRKKTWTSDECRLAEVVGTTFGQKLAAGDLDLCLADFERVIWTETSQAASLLELRWRTGAAVAVIDTFGARLSVQQVRLLQDEPPFLQWINLLGADVAVDTSAVHVPAGRGFRAVGFDDGYCYMQHQREYVGKYKPIGTVGVWHQSLSEVEFVRDTTEGELGQLGGGEGSLPYP